MPNYRALVPGGFFSSNPEGTIVNGKRTPPVSIRMNNFGAINGEADGKPIAWIRAFPGYLRSIVTTPGNATAVFETPEQGVAAWWELLRRYRNSATPARTISQIIRRYGGSGQDYGEYVASVSQRMHASPSTEIIIDGSDDVTLLAFAKAMAREEAGRDTPLSDDQLRYGFRLGRAYHAGERPPAPSIGKEAGGGLGLGGIAGAIAHWFGGLDPMWVVGIAVVVGVVAAFAIGRARRG